MTLQQPELTLRGIILGIILAVVLAASNTYLALKIGILTSASIPAAVIAMGVLRYFKNSNILENNLVQTAASAGEAIAGGVVYTVPALIIIHYITHFSYWHNFFIALIGGILGILFSVPLRRVLIHDKNLKFPEAQAITKILQMGMHDKQQVYYLLKGSMIGAMLEFCQSGLQIVANNIQGFILAGKSLIGFGTGFSATLIGAGYLIGINIGISLLIGALTGYVILMPLVSRIFHITAAPDFISHQLRFMGIGSLLTAGIITLLLLSKPIIKAVLTPFKIQTGVRDFYTQKTLLSKHTKDIPVLVVLTGIIIFTGFAYFLLNHLLPFKSLGFPSVPSTIICVLFVLIVGFIFAAICGYFSGMVGVSASPGSAIVIGGLLIAAFSVRFLLHLSHAVLTPEIIINASAIVIVLISMVTGIACITNDNIQDLKVGQLVGSTPYKQQLMLMIGVIASASVIPLLMELLFNVYGIGGVFPHAGMDASKMLPAPVPAVLAAVTQAVFAHDIPLQMLFIGAGIIIIFFLLNIILKKLGFIKFNFSILGIAMGLYLPLSSSTALFIGSMLAYFFASNRGILSACGIVAGAALTDVLLAIPFGFSGNPNILKLFPDNKGYTFSVILALISITLLAKMFYHYYQQRKYDDTDQ